LEVRRKKNTDWSSENWIAKRSFAIYIFDLVKLCSEKRKDKIQLNRLFSNTVPIHPAFFKHIFTAAKWHGNQFESNLLNCLKTLALEDVSKCMNVCCAM
jgi:hypothetical protein